MVDEMTKTLEELGIEYGCAKAHWKRGTRTRHFCQEVYPRHFEELRDKPINLLEMGILGGGSLRMWRDYFPNAKVYGLDIEKHRCFTEDRIECFHGDQADLALLEKITNEIEFDIIIDDAGHDPKDTKTAFDFLFSRLTAGGMYIIEDLWIHYEKETGEPRKYSFVQYMKDEIIDTIIDPEIEDKSFKSVHLYDKIAVLYKGS
jgi:cephalosporin hydroxylase